MVFGKYVSVSEAKSIFFFGSIKYQFGVGVAIYGLSESKIALDPNSQ